MDGIAVARALHVLAVVIWVGGVSTVAIPAVRRGDLGDRLKAFQATERRFVCQARTAVLVTLAAVARVVAAFATGWSMPLLVGSASLWIAAFAFFVLFYGPMPLLPRPTR